MLRSVTQNWRLWKQFTVLFDVKEKTASPIMKINSLKQNF